MYCIITKRLLFEVFRVSKIVIDNIDLKKYQMPRLGLCFRKEISMLLRFCCNAFRKITSLFSLELPAILLPRMKNVFTCSFKRKSWTKTIFQAKCETRNSIQHIIVTVQFIFTLRTILASLRCSCYW